jgi:hypothetical protein
MGWACGQNGDTRDARRIFGGETFLKTEMGRDRSTNHAHRWTILLVLLPQCKYTSFQWGRQRPNWPQNRPTSLYSNLQYVLPLAFVFSDSFLCTDIQLYVCNYHRPTLRLSWRIILERKNLVTAILILLCFQELYNMKQAGIPHQTIYLYFAFLPLYYVTVAVMFVARLCLVLHADEGTFMSKLQ